MTRPTRIRSLAIAVAAATAAVAVASPADAAQKKSTPSSKEAFFRCKDGQGQTHFGQAIPAECMDRDVEVIDQSGRVVRIIEGRQSLETRAQREAEADAKRKAIEGAQQRDRTLLATYLTVADIERLRDQRLGQLQAQAQVTAQYIVNLKEREERLIADVARYRPYAKSPKAPPVPDHVAEEMVNTVNGLQVYQEELAKNTTEQTRLRDEFASDIARFKELKGLN
jgi:hypothetical protein